jgi:hypothetical protein
MAVVGGHGDVEVQADCKPDGIVSLKALAISGFRTVRVPRVWDSPARREAERGLRDELGRLARRFKTVPDEWTKSISELATWIRYTPPPPGAKPVEPWFDDQSEDDDDGGRKRRTDWPRSNHPRAAAGAVRWRPGRSGQHRRKWMSHVQSFVTGTSEGGALRLVTRVLATPTWPA